MRVTVKLFANFRQGRFKVREQELDEGTAVATVIAALAIDPTEVGVIMINSRQAEADQRLKDQDVLAIFPIIGGG